MSKPILTATHAPDADFDVEAYLLARDVAMNTDCGFPACNGGGHEVGDPAKWSHRLSSSRFDGAVSVDIDKDPSRAPFAVLLMDADVVAWTAAELRVEADLYEAYPAFLRARADELDTLTNNATVNR
jgi:hypothetical protein